MKVGVAKENEPMEKKTLLDTIKLPLVYVFQWKNKEVGNLENQTAKAGLASMETLDDESVHNKNKEDFKTVSLNDKIDDEIQDIQEPSIWRKHLRAYRVVISVILILALLMIIIILVTISSNEEILNSPIRKGKFIEAVTTCGIVEGIIEDDTAFFRGIPYARPPVQELRFRYTKPLNDLKYCWNGTLLVHNDTENCLQIHSNSSISGKEDCLTLDIVTPYVRYENPLPVIVLIGAETLIGGSPGKMRPSARYAKDKEVVFVRPNFRLGALGFLALEIISNSDYPHRSGNYGLFDILTALQWVQLNIEHFGGDPKSVTLFGHRAGATLVTALTTVKDANKYFARAWASSGGAIHPKKNLTRTEIDNRRFLDRVQCKDIVCLRNVDPIKLLNAVEDTWRKPQPDLPSVEEMANNAHEWLVVDGVILRDYPASIWAKEELKVKLIIGSTAQAGSSEKLLLKHKEWTEELIKLHINESFLSAKNLTVTVFKMYPITYKGLSSMITDIRIICPIFAISSQMNKVPFYVVTQSRGDQNIADIESDIDAILGRYELKTPEQRRYVLAMQDLFYHYVWHGTVEYIEKPGQKVLLVGNGVSPTTTYSECIFWLNSNIASTYAALE